MAEIRGQSRHAAPRYHAQHDGGEANEAMIVSPPSSVWSMMLQTASLSMFTSISSSSRFSAASLLLR